MVKELDPLTELRAFVARYPTQAAAAAALAISQSYLSDLLAGRRHISDAMLNKLGLTRKLVKLVKV